MNGNGLNWEEVVAGVLNGQQVPGLLQEVKTGSADRVFFCRQADTYLKILLAPSSPGDRLAGGRLRRTLRNERRLRRAGVEVPLLLEYGKVAGREWLVTASLEGVTLENWFRRCPDMADRKKKVMLETVANAVAQLHRSGIAHGDLNPTNVFITADGGVTLLDNEKNRWFWWLSRRRRLKNLYQLNFAMLPGLTLRHRLFFANIYRQAAGLQNFRQDVRWLCDKARERLKRKGKL